MTLDWTDVRIKDLILELFIKNHNLNLEFKE